MKSFRRYELRHASMSVVVLILAIGCSATTSVQGDMPRVVWNVPQSAFGGTSGQAMWWGRPLIIGQTVFLQAGPSLAAVDLSSGAIRWSRRLTDRSNLNASTLVGDASIVVAVLPEVVLALDASGNDRWRRSIPTANPVATPLANGDRVFVGTRDSRVIALSKADGTILWDRQLGPEWTNPAFVRGVGFSGDTLYVNLERYLAPNGYLATGVVVALDRDDGTELWRYEAPEQQSAFYSDPVVTDSLLIVSDAFGHRLLGIGRFDGTARWEVRGAPTSYGPDMAVLRNDTVFAGFADRHVYAADARDGRLLWKTFTPASVSSVATCRSFVVANNQSVEVLGLNGRRYRPLLAPDEDGVTEFGILTSEFAVADSIAIVVGSKYVTAVRC